MIHINTFTLLDPSLKTKKDGEKEHVLEGKKGGGIKDGEKKDRGKKDGGKREGGKKDGGKREGGKFLLRKYNYLEVPGKKRTSRRRAFFNNYL